MSDSHQATRRELDRTVHELDELRVKDDAESSDSPRLDRWLATLVGRAGSDLLLRASIKDCLSSWCSQVENNSEKIQSATGPPVGGSAHGSNSRLKKRKVTLLRISANFLSNSFCGTLVIPALSKNSRKISAKANNLHGPGSPFLLA